MISCLFVTLFWYLGRACSQRKWYNELAILKYLFTCLLPIGPTTQYFLHQLGIITRSHIEIKFLFLLLLSCVFDFVMAYYFAFVRLLELVYLIYSLSIIFHELLLKLGWDVTPFCLCCMSSFLDLFGLSYYYYRWFSLFLYCYLFIDVYNRFLKYSQKVLISMA